MDKGNFRADSLVSAWYFWKVIEELEGRIVRLEEVLGVKQGSGQENELYDEDPIA